MAAPNFVKDNLLLHYHAARATGTAPASNASAANVWKDLSGNGLDGTLKQFAYNENSGWTSDGLIFDGIDDHVEIVNNGLGIFDNQEFTVEAWITPELPGTRAFFSYDYSVQHPYCSVMVRTTRNGNYDAIQFSHTSFKESTESIDYSGGVAHLPMERDATKPIHCVATFNKGLRKIYTDTNIGATATVTGAIEYIDKPVYIGKTITNNKSYFKGTIHLLRYYTKALNAEEVAQNYATGLAWPDDLVPDSSGDLFKVSTKVVELKNKIYVQQRESEIDMIQRNIRTWVL